MEDMFTLAGWIVIIFGILQIILFFKVWMMIDDVKKIKEALPNTPSNLSPAKMEFIIGNTDKAKEMAIKEFVCEVYKLYSKVCTHRYTDQEYTEKFNNLENKYRDMIDNTSSCFEFSKFSTFEKAKKIFH